jgi:hypothetical protein
MERHAHVCILHVPERSTLIQIRWTLSSTTGARQASRASHPCAQSFILPSFGPFVEDHVFSRHCLGDHVGSLHSIMSDFIIRAPPLRSRQGEQHIRHAVERNNNRPVISAGSHKWWLRTPNSQLSQSLPIPYDLANLTTPTDATITHHPVITYSIPRMNNAMDPCEATY